MEELGKFLLDLRSELNSVNDSISHLSEPSHGGLVSAQAVYLKTLLDKIDEKLKEKTENLLSISIKNFDGLSSQPDPAEKNKNTTKSLKRRTKLFPQSFSCSYLIEKCRKEEPVVIRVAKEAKIQRNKAKKVTLKPITSLHNPPNYIPKEKVHQGIYNLIHQKLLPKNADFTPAFLNNSHPLMSISNAPSGPSSSTLLPHTKTTLYHFDISSPDSSLPPKEANKKEEWSPTLVQWDNQIPTKVLALEDVTYNPNRDREKEKVKRRGIFFTEFDDEAEENPFAYEEPQEPSKTLLIPRERKAIVHSLEESPSTLLSQTMPSSYDDTMVCIQNGKMTSDTSMKQLKYISGDRFHALMKILRALEQLCACFSFSQPLTISIPALLMAMRKRALSLSNRNRVISIREIVESSVSSEGTIRCSLVSSSLLQRVYYTIIHQTMPQGTSLQQLLRTCAANCISAWYLGYTVRRRYSAVTRRMNAVQKIQKIWRKQQRYRELRGMIGEKREEYYKMYKEVMVKYCEKSNVGSDKEQIEIHLLSLSKLPSLGSLNQNAGDCRTIQNAQLEQVAMRAARALQSHIRVIIVTDISLPDELKDHINTLLLALSPGLNEKSALPKIEYLSCSIANNYQAQQLLQVHNISMCCSLYCSHSTLRRLRNFNLTGNAVLVPLQTSPYDIYVSALAGIPLLAGDPLSPRMNCIGIDRSATLDFISELQLPCHYSRTSIRNTEQFVQSLVEVFLSHPEVCQWRVTLNRNVNQSLDPRVTCSGLVEFTDAIFIHLRKEMEKKVEQSPHLSQTIRKKTALMCVQRALQFFFRPLNPEQCSSWKEFSSGINAVGCTLEACKIPIRQEFVRSHEVHLELLPHGPPNFLGVTESVSEHLDLEVGNTMVMISSTPKGESDVLLEVANFIGQLLRTRGVLGYFSVRFDIFDEVTAVQEGEIDRNRYSQSVATNPVPEVVPGEEDTPEKLIKYFSHILSSHLSSLSLRVTSKGEKKEEVEYRRFALLLDISLGISPSFSFLWIQQRVKQSNAVSLFIPQLYIKNLLQLSLKQFLQQAREKSFSFDSNTALGVMVLSYNRTEELLSFAIVRENYQQCFHTLSRLLSFLGSIKTSGGVNHSKFSILSNTQKAKAFAAKANREECVENDVHLPLQPQNYTLHSPYVKVNNIQNAAKNFIKNLFSNN